MHISRASTKTVDLSLAPGDAIPAAENSRTLVLLGRDRIGLDEPAQAVISEVSERAVRLELLAGTIACEVAPRDGGQAFAVEAGEVTVRVVGTRFMVSRAGGSTTVLVDEGAVEIRRPGMRPATTRAGQGLEILEDGAVNRIEASDGARAQLNQLVAERQLGQKPDRETDAPQAPPADTAQPEMTAAREAAADRGSRPAGLDTWRSWILAGRYDDAERALTAHLAKAPNDSEALMLLANCRRKAGRWRAAVSAYERLIETAGSSRANMARFKAGVLYQERLGDHAVAAKMFEGYLRAGSAAKPLESEAMLRLGKSLLALGRTQRAEAVLRATAARQDGSMASLRARELLEKITDGK
jgi:TolA-binding protein